MAAENSENSDTSDNAPKGDYTIDPLQEKHYRHAEAQRRYRERNLKKTRTKARLRMERHCSKVYMSLEASNAAAARRQVVDAEYRERCREKKFIKKFGEKVFVRNYLPLHDIFGPYLPGQKFVAEEEVEEHSLKAKEKKSKGRKGKNKVDTRSTSA
ncbi:hypothetical protein B0H16DRAFT_1746639 [Mycena metata]|uniref:Uncharacterized protein n=1 Tax=Mycena metata TaxID=1033252 RepID=A0AAD7GWX7_9AGAR|nr:hypothetical protein B0H16DRAFT_1746639 [Mycena metata]